MVQDANVELENDAYLMIVYGEERDKVSVKPYNVKVAKSSRNLLNTVLKSNIATVALAGFTSKIGQNIAGKVLSTATLGRINSSVYDIMSDGKINVAEVAEDFIGSCTNSIDNVATDMGFPTPSSLYTALMPSGSGVISKDFTKFLTKNMDKEDKEEEEAINNIDVKVLKLKLVTSDSESWGIEVPTRKTEKGFEIATAIANQNKTKDFEVVLSTNSRRATDMYQIKDQLEQIKNDKIPFDIYINDKDVYHQYKWTNCIFSNLSFNPEGRNILRCQMSVVEIPEWTLEYVKLENYSQKNAGNGGKAGVGKSNSAKSGIKKSTKSVASQAKTATKTQQNRIYPASRQADEFLRRQYKLGKSDAEIAKMCKDKGLPYSQSDIKNFRDRGWLSGQQKYSKAEIKRIKEENKRLGL